MAIDHIIGYSHATGTTINGVVIPTTPRAMTVDEHESLTLQDLITGGVLVTTQNDPNNPRATTTNDAAAYSMARKMAPIKDYLDDICKSLDASSSYTYETPSFTTGNTHIVRTTQASNTLVNGYAYQIQVAALGTGTTSGYNGLIYEIGGVWTLKMLARAGASGNHPIIALNATPNITLTHNHATAYSYLVRVKAIHVGNTDTISPAYFDALAGQVSYNGSELVIDAYMMGSGSAKYGSNTPLLLKSVVVNGKFSVDTSLGTSAPTYQMEVDSGTCSHLYNLYYTGGWYANDATKWSGRMYFNSGDGSYNWHTCPTQSATPTPRATMMLTQAGELRLYRPGGVAEYLGIQRYDGYVNYMAYEDSTDATNGVGEHRMNTNAVRTGVNARWTVYDATGALITLRADGRLTLTNALFVPPSTAAQAMLNVGAFGVTVTSPADGDVWKAGADSLCVRMSTNTRTVAWREASNTWGGTQLFSNPLVVNATSASTTAGAVYRRANYGLVWYEAGHAQEGLASIYVAPVGTALVNLNTNTDLNGGTALFGSRTISTTAMQIGTKVVLKARVKVTNTAANTLSLRVVWGGGTVLGTLTWARVNAGAEIFDLECVGVASSAPGATAATSWRMSVMGSSTIERDTSITWTSGEATLATSTATILKLEGQWTTALATSSVQILSSSIDLV